jgi:hypothetical protein
VNTQLIIPGNPVETGNPVELGREQTAPKVLGKHLVFPLKQLSRNQQKQQRIELHPWVISEISVLV